MRPIREANKKNSSLDVGEVEALLVYKGVYMSRDASTQISNLYLGGTWIGQHTIRMQPFYGRRGVLYSIFTGESLKDDAEEYTHGDLMCIEEANKITTSNRDVRHIVDNPYSRSRDTACCVVFRDLGDYLKYLIESKIITTEMVETCWPEGSM